MFGAKITKALRHWTPPCKTSPMPRLLPKKSIWEPLKKSITKEIITPMVEQAKQEYGRDLKLSDQKRFESAAKAKWT